MKKKTMRGGSRAVQVAVIGASLAGLAATAYFLFGSKGKKNQKHLKAWAIKMKGDVVEKLETARTISEPIYHKIIDSVAARYEKRMKTGRKEIKVLAQDLKKHWTMINRSTQSVKSKVKR